MKSIVVYFSQTGNTKRVAEAVYSGIKSATGQCELGTLWDVGGTRLAEFDLIGFGCPVHRTRAPARFIDFEKSLPIMDGKHCFLFATHGPVAGMIFRDVGQVLLEKQMVVIGYRGWYGTDWALGAPKPYFTDGHPDSIDLKEAANFGREMVERSLRIRHGEKDLEADVLSIREFLFDVQPLEIRRNKEKCRYPICRLCLDNCPVDGCIDLSPRAVTFADLRTCIQCFFCHLICPTGAVETDAELLAKQFKEATQTIAIPILDRAKARGEFRSLVDKVDLDTPGYKVGQRPQFVIKAAPCILACPVHIDIPGYLTLAAEGRLEDASRLLRGTNPLPAVCGRICYHPCEDACERQHVDQPVAVASLERFVTDQVNIEEIKVPRVSKNGQKVAIIGSGPGGLAAAHDLALLGYEVTIFEALPEAGGMLRVGIPDYRLPKQVLKKEIGYIERLGVKIKTNTRIGGQIKLDELRRDYQAVLIAAGAQESLRLQIPGEESAGVIPGVEFLKTVNMGKRVGIGNRVAVIGGGNVAIDAARVARRLGSSVTIVYRRSPEEMPATSAEVNAATEEGVEITFLAAPIEIISEGGKVSKMKCIKMTLGAPDASGRKCLVPEEGCEFTMEVDSVIPALGQKSNLEFLEGIGVKVSSEGNLIADEVTLSTNIEGVFAGGDLVTGAARVVDAIAAGKRAARSIDNYLQGIPLAVGQTGGRRAQDKPTEGEIKMLREQVPVQNRLLGKELAPKERINDFSEVELGFDLVQGQQEARRCLKCEWKS